VKSSRYFLGSCKQNLDLVVRLVIRLSGLKLFKSLSQLVNDQVLRAYHRDECDNTELVTCDGRFVELAEVSDLSQKFADVIVLCNCLADRFIAYIDAVLLSQRLENMVLALEYI